VETAQDILDYLREQEQALVGFLERLALAGSPSAEPASQDEVLGALSGLGYRAWRVPGRRSGGHLYARPEWRGRRTPAQLLLGHCDTVWPLGTLAEMPVEVKDGVITGPGVYDMKGGLAQIVFALRALRDFCVNPPLTPVVFVNSDEEIGSRESTRHIRRLARVAERAFVMEPSLGPSGKLKTARKGVGRFSVVVEGSRRTTSRSALLPSLPSHLYKGHVLIGREKATMRDYAPDVSEREFELPVVLLVGISMSAGKTTSAKLIVRLLKGEGLAVVGAKLTGAGRYRDILSMQDAGAQHIFDFVDAGLPSTVVPEKEYRKILRRLLSRIAAADADVLVAEVGASPLEPYNGAAAIEEIGPNVRCTVLSASDPYAVTGVTSAFGNRPDLVTGLATSTSAGIELVEKLSGIKALNVLD
jgi:acetylornithine deacetylase/succinyl-diaminopimelate desuccinylase-like protein